MCIRGPSVFSGYYKDEEKTREAIDEKGWYHTGDIGQWNKNGSLSIIDRKKNIFKLSQGEYIAAESIEGVYQKNKFVELCFIYGDSLQSSVIAIIIPDKEVLEEWAKNNAMEGKSLKELCEDPKVVEMVFKDTCKTARELKLKGFEIARAIHLESEPWTVENEFVTPTFKLKRPQLKEHYKPVIDKLYERLVEEEKKMAQKEEEGTKK